MARPRGVDRTDPECQPLVERPFLPVLHGALRRRVVIGTLTGVALGVGLSGGIGCSSGQPNSAPAVDVAIASSPTANETATRARPATEAEQARAQAHIGPLKKALMGGLSGAMKEGGPTQAIEVCRTLAPKVAAEQSQNGVEVGRTSHKLRNPENEARGWVEPILKGYLATADQSPVPQWVELSTDRVGYVEPIGTMGLCLQCHGTEIAPEVQASISNNYPQDQAVGFAAGDLRGVFWLEMPRLENE